MPTISRLLAACVAWLVCACPVVADAPWSGPGRDWSRFFVDNLTPQPAQPPHPSVARVIVPQGSSVSYGSGTLVAVGDKHGVVITNWHVIHESAGVVLVRFPDGFQSAATILKTDREWDLAALGIWKPNAAPVPLATQPPRPGDVLTIAGYGSGHYRAATGRCTQYVAPGDRRPFEMVEVSAAARQGDSGGPIFNHRGELAGVLFGEGGGHTAGSYCGRVQQFLANVTPVVTGERLASLPQPSSAGQTATNIPLAKLDQPPALGMADPPPARPAPHVPSFRPAVAPTGPVTTGRSSTQPRPPIVRPTPPLGTQPGPPSTAAVTVDDFWAMLGETPLERVKTTLAGIGGLTVLWFVGRMLARERHGKKAAVAK